MSSDIVVEKNPRHADAVTIEDLRPRAVIRHHYGCGTATYLIMSEPTLETVGDRRVLMVLARVVLPGQHGNTPVLGASQRLYLADLGIVPYRHAEGTAWNACHCTVVRPA